VSPNVGASPLGLPGESLSGKAITALLGLKVSPIYNYLGSNFITKRAVLEITNSDMQTYKGKTRVVTLANTSRVIGTAYQKMDDSDTSNDPHFKDTGGKWENPPCYVITIERATGMNLLLGPFASSPTEPGGRVIVVDVIDATNGKMLLGYQMAINRNAK